MFSLCSLYRVQRLRAIRPRVLGFKPARYRCVVAESMCKMLHVKRFKEKCACVCSDWLQKVLRRGGVCVELLICMQVRVSNSDQHVWMYDIDLLLTTWCFSFAPHIECNDYERYDHVFWIASLPGTVVSLRNRCVRCCVSNASKKSVLVVAQIEYRKCWEEAEFV